MIEERLNINITTSDDIKGHPYERYELPEKTGRRCSNCGVPRERPANKSVKNWNEQKLVFCSKDCFRKSRIHSGRGYLGYWLFLLEIEPRDFWEKFTRYNGFGLRDFKYILSKDLPVKRQRDKGCSKDIGLQIMFALSDFHPSLAFEDRYFDYRLLYPEDKYLDWPESMIADGSASYRRSEFKKLIDFHQINPRDFRIRYGKSMDQRKLTPQSRNFKKRLIEISDREEFVTDQDSRKDVNALKIIMNGRVNLKPADTLIFSEYLAMHWGLFVDYRMLMEPYMTVIQVNDMKRKYLNENK